MAKVSKEKLALKRAKLEARLSELDDRLYNESLREHGRIENMGFGYAMRHSKINFSTRKSDKIRARIKDLQSQLEAIKIIESEKNIL